MTIQIIGHKHRTHFAFARRGSIQIRDHHKRYHFALLLVTMVNLLCQFVQRRSEHIDAFVFPFLTSGDSNKQCVFRHNSAELFSRYATQGFTGLLTFRVEIFSFRHIGGFESVRGDDIDGFIQQLLALACSQVTDSGEAVSPMRRLFLHRMLAHHIQFRRHLVSVITLEIVVQRLSVARYRTTYSGGMSGKQSSYLRTMIFQIENRESRLPFIGMHTEIRSFGSRLSIFN